MDIIFFLNIGRATNYLRKMPDSLVFGSALRRINRTTEKNFLYS
jgi:hypothetical protein